MIRRRWQWLTWCSVLLLVITSGGCTRRYFRKATDTDVHNLLKEKDQDPRWKIAQFHVYPDPRARFADWTNPDRPPMPPDDRMAKLLSPNPQKPYHHSGIEYIEGQGYLKLLEEWDAENRGGEAEKQRIRELAKSIGEKSTSRPVIGPAGPTVPIIDVLARPELQNELSYPVTRSGLLPVSDSTPAEKKKPYLLSIDQAVELGIINSREFQTERESLYLAALPVSLERFAFATQFYAMEEVLRQRATGGVVGPQDLWANNVTAGFSKLFPTGALLLLQFANQTVVNLGSSATGKSVSNQSQLSLDIIQPFLRGGGRAVTLEPLTQAERNLLYSVRDYARFRQQFYAYIAVGQAAFIPGQQAGVSALTAGTVQTPAAFVPNATPLTYGQFGPPGPVQVAPGAAGRFGPIPPPGANPQGYLNTLLQKAQLVSFVKNVNSLEYFFRLLQVYNEGGIVNPVQVGSVEQTLLGAIASMLQNWVQYRNSLDLFRIQLGLPPTVPIELDDAPLEPMYELIRRYEANSTTYAQAVNESQVYGKYDEVAKLRERLHYQFSSSELVKGLPFAQDGPRRWAAWEKLKQPELNAKLKSVGAERRKMLDYQADLKAKEKSLTPAEEQKLQDLDFEYELGVFENLLRKYEVEPWKGIGDINIRYKQQQAAFTQLHAAFVRLLASAVRERLAQVRDSWPPLPPVYLGDLDLLSASDDIGLEAVVRTALENRLDLMNQQAQLVDSWRKLRVAANALLGTFNVEYNFETTSPPGLGQPLVFSGSGTQHNLVMNTQLPLVRRQERNAYRSALIAYQQQRRDWMEAMDQVAFAVRFQLRNLRITAYNYHRVQKRQMELAYLQVDQALQAFSQPVAPAGPQGVGGVGPPGAAGGTGTGDPAALTQQLLNTQRSLLNAQTDLYSQWLGYLQNRIYLYRDLGLMPLDARGVWIDDFTYPPSERPPHCFVPGGDIGPNLLPGGLEQLPTPTPLPPARFLEPTPLPPAE